MKGKRVRKLIAGGYFGDEWVKQAVDQVPVPVSCVQSENPKLILSSCHCKLGNVLSFCHINEVNVF